MLTASLIFALFCPAWARLGESPQECDARYGPESEIFSNGARTYKPKEVDITISCDFKNGKCSSIRFSPTPGKSLTDDGVKMFLEKNSKAKNFKYMGIYDDFIKVYHETESGRYAFLNISKDRIFVWRDPAEPTETYACFAGGLLILGNELSAAYGKHIKAGNAVLEKF